MSFPFIAQKLGDFFAAHHDGMVCVYLYGSQARGQAGPRSDVDIAVLMEKTPLPTLDGMGLDLASEIEEQLKMKVDLTILNRAPVDLIHRILRDGILLYEGDKSARIRFEVKARSEYFDLLPYLHGYRRSGQRSR